MSALVIIVAVVVIALLGLLGFKVFWAVWYGVASWALSRTVRVNGLRGVHDIGSYT